MSTTRPIAWDPTRPAVLLIPEANKVVHPLYAGTGTGCNTHELSALMQLIQAQEGYYYNYSNTNKNEAKDVKQLFRNYRAAVSNCIDAWQEEEGEQELQPEQQQDRVNLELLKMNYAVLHLSDIFLPLLLPYNNNTTTNSSWTRRDPYTIPGRTTADTIRYFRYNHLRDLADEFPEYDEIMTATQPESSFESYWTIVIKLVMRGCLEEAWAVLGKHSLYAAATAVGPDRMPTMREIEQGFLFMRDLLLLAPVPGGRTNLFDNDLELPERIDETAAAILDDLDVQPLDYQFWEPKAAAHGDLPMEFEADAAKRKHKLWQDYVKSVMQAPSFVLPRHVPEIASILAILSGDIREAPCDNWYEALVVELLYRQPDIRPKHLSSRARHVAKSFANDELSDIEEALLNMALLCSLFVDSAILEDPMSDRKIDFLCEAADAIRSSLSKTEDQDMGVQLSVRLLLPYALEPKHRGERVRSFIAEILEHYAPSTERYARAMVALVRPLVEKKSLQLLDATSTMLLSLYRQFMEQFDFQAAVLVLLDGLELEALILPDRELGSCYQTLSLLCVDTAERILSLLFETEKEKVTLLADAKVVGEAVTGAFVSRANDVPEAMLLARSMELVASLDENGRDETNNLILQILQGDVDRSTGGPILRNLHWHVLRIAQHAIDNHPTAAFDTKCIRLSEYAELSKSYIVDKKVVTLIETALANGLAKAFITENARKANLLDKGHEKTVCINTSNLHNHSLEVQQRFVEELLDA